MARTSPPPLAALTLLLLVIFFVFHSGAAAARHLPEEGVRDGAADGLELLESAAAGNGNDELSAVSEMMGPAEEASACEEEGNDDVDDERLQRRMLRDAPHLDYIYTQRRGKP